MSCPHAIDGRSGSRRWNPDAFRPPGKLMLPILGGLSLLWFLVRVIPKPSRATYPCQRAALPLASVFFAWMIGLLGSSLALLKGKRAWRHSQPLLAVVLFAVAAAFLGASLLARNPPQ